MKIGIDCRFYNESGIGRYIRNLLYGLQKYDLDNQYFIFLLDKDIQKFEAKKNFRVITLDLPWYSVSEQFMLPSILSKYNLDLVHFPHFNIPLFYFGKFVVTIHDLIHQNFQTGDSTTHSRIIYSLKKIGYRRVFTRAVYGSCKILTPTNSVKAQLTKVYPNLNSQKVQVTYEGVDKSLMSFKVQDLDETYSDLCQKFNISKPYLFYVGSAHPHKNILSLVEAFKLVKARYPKLKLVLSGKKNVFWRKLERLNEEGIIITGFVSEQELTVLYKNAQVYIEPSLAEGFGLPLVEAMSLGTSIACSDIPALNEVAGEAAFYFNPKKITDIEKTIINSMSDQNLRAKKIKIGLELSKKFSWDRMAKETLEVYKQCESL